jgi:hypothetical protein
VHNCLTFALSIWRYGGGDHLVIRKSHWGWFPHFKVMFEMQDGTLVIKEFVPTQPRSRWIPPLFFRGEVVTTTYRKIP